MLPVVNFSSCPILVPRAEICFNREKTLPEALPQIITSSPIATAELAAILALPVTASSFKISQGKRLRNSANISAIKLTTSRNIRD